MSLNIWQAESQELQKVAGQVNINDGVTSETSVWSSKKVADSLVDKVPFKFGITDDGQYGYIKDGEDTVTPFGSSAIHDGFENGEFKDVSIKYFTYSGVTQKFAVNDKLLTVNAGGGNGFGFEVDFTKYKKATLVVVSALNTEFSWFGVMSNASWSASSTNFIKSVGIKPSSGATNIVNQTYEIDLSDVSGKHYLMYQSGGANNTFVISKMILE